ncbi:MAG: hypothetical protein IT198_04400 [Acidimicrobiia bacterium]|nr:hypothetical protein [Acidimicrobiia bacterium]
MAEADDFFECGHTLREVAVMGWDEAARGPDPDEAPALRELGRPPCWSAPNSPETVLGGIYASAARRAFDVLARKDE